MDKVWLVIGYDPLTTGVLSVWSTQDKALAELKRILNGNQGVTYSWYDVEGWEVN